MIELRYIHLSLILIEQLTDTRILVDLQLDIFLDLQLAPCADQHPYHYLFISQKIANALSLGSISEALINQLFGGDSRRRKTAPVGAILPLRGITTRLKKAQIPGGRNRGSFRRRSFCFGSLISAGLGWGTSGTQQCTHLVQFAAGSVQKHSHS